MSATTEAVGLDRTSILDAVRHMYDDVATCPTRQFHFPTGRRACEYVGYPSEELDELPPTAVESFAGVGYPFLGNQISQGDTVVDIGSGSGVDVLIAARRTGPSGRVVGIDMTQSMIDKATANLQVAGAAHAWLVEGNAEDLPLEDAMADVVTSNGVINLVPDKRQAFAEIYRILKPGGSIQISDIVLNKPVSAKSKSNSALWAECIVGAEPEQEYLELIRQAGFEDVLIIDRLDYFARSDNESTRNAARDLGAHTIVLTAQKR